ncbi:MAG: hypothetical protein HQL82_17280 [Magnetococcales bacterium]|nr:hypothetical protein [Magnetococcales bacterium]
MTGGMSRGRPRRRRSRWNPKRVAQAMENAAATLMRLPPVGPRTPKSFWPRLARDLEAGLPRPRRDSPPPDSRQIEAMDRCLEWLRWLPPDQARLVWLRAERRPWKMIQEELAIGRTKGWMLWMTALSEICLRLDMENGHSPSRT